MPTPQLDPRLRPILALAVLLACVAQLFCRAAGNAAVPAGADSIVITRQPEGGDVPRGSLFRLTVEATGPIEGYAWMDPRGNVVARSGPGPSSTLELVNAVSARPGYFVVVTNATTAVTSATAIVHAKSIGPHAAWKGRLPKLVVDQGTAVPGFPELRFAALLPDLVFPSTHPIPTITYRNGKVHFVGRTTGGGYGLFRFSDGRLRTLVYTNTLASNGALVGGVSWPGDEQNGVVHFSTIKTLNRWSENGVELIADENTPLPGEPSSGFRLFGPVSGRGAGLTFGTSDAIYLLMGGNLTLIADHTTDLPGANTGFSGAYGNPGAPYYVTYDGQSIVLLSGGNGATGFYKAMPGGAMTKLVDSTDVVPGSTNQFRFFGQVDIDGGLAFGVANGSTGGSTLWAFDDNGGITRVGNALAFAAASSNTAYYSYLFPTIRRWSPQSNELVFATTLIDGDSFQRVWWIDGQGDDLVFGVTDGTLQRIYLVSGPVGGDTAPIIVLDPWDINVADQASASFAVTAAGAPPLSFQWRHEGEDVAGGTNATLTLPVADASLAGNYSVVVTNGFGSVTSHVARLTAVTPMSLFVGSQLYISTNLYGSDVTLLVRASGPRPLTFQWRTNGTEVPGAMQRSYQIAKLTEAARGLYAVQVTDETTNVIVSLQLTNIQPLIIQQPRPVTSVAGSTVSFLVEAVGVPPLTYQWFRQQASVTSSITNATEATLVLTNISMAEAAGYSVRVYSEGLPIQSSLSDSATLVVLLEDTPAPLLGPPTRFADHFEFTLPTESGRTYDLQFAPTLSNGMSWTPLQILYGDGNTRVVTFPTPAAQGFYRVIRRP